MSIWSFIVNAGGVVKCVMLILFFASVISWMIIVQRSLVLKKVEQMMRQFEDKFWSGDSLSVLYKQQANQQDLLGSALIFQAGMDELQRLRDKRVETDALREGVVRAMRISCAKETERLEQHLPFLATVGSTAPYIGLFGTVWGIMTSFRALGSVQQATIAMVAPGISEALIATAIGLFAAIPAVIAYNRYSSLVEKRIAQLELFQEEFIHILHRDLSAPNEQTA